MCRKCRVSSKLFTVKSPKGGTVAIKQSPCKQCNKNNEHNTFELDLDLPSRTFIFQKACQCGKVIEVLDIPKDSFSKLYNYLIVLGIEPKLPKD